MKNSTYLKLTSAVILFMLLFFRASNTAFAGQIWDAYSRISTGAKSIASDLLGKAGYTSYSNDFKKDWGISSRMSNFINSLFSTLRSSAGSIYSSINSRLPSLNTLLGSPSGLLNSPSLNNLRQRLPNLATLSSNLPSLRDSLRKMGTTLDTNINLAAGNFRTNIYSLSSSLKQSSSVIFSQNQLRSSLLSGKLPLKYDTTSFSGKITDFKNIRFQ